MNKLIFLLFFSLYITTSHANEPDFKNGEKLIKSCYEGNIKNCILISKHKLTQQYPLSDPSKYENPIALISDACNKLLFPPACSLLGGLYFQGKEFPQDIQKAMKLYNSACEKAFFPACLSLGKIHAKNKNYMKAKEYYKQTCDNTIPEGCTLLARLYETKKIKGKSTKEIDDLYQQACTHNEILACSTLAQRLLRAKQAVPEELQIKLQHACNTQDSTIACYMTGAIYFDNELNNNIQLRNIASKLCEEKLTTVEYCELYKDLKLHTTQQKEQKSLTAYKLLKHNCQSGHNDSCQMLPIIKTKFIDRIDTFNQLIHHTEIVLKKACHNNIKPDKAFCTRDK